MLRRFQLSGNYRRFWLLFATESNFAPGSSYVVCFTPSNNCADKIVDTVNQAKKQILVQAYNFTDIYIAGALIKAKKKGIDVQIILDKSQLKTRYSLIQFFVTNNIYPFIDYEPAIAHNKIIIIDEHTVIGGSYNLSKGAANKNAENVTIIKDHNFAREYVKYWHLRKSKSVVYSELGLRRSIYHKRSR